MAIRYFLDKTFLRSFEKFDIFFIIVYNYAMRAAKLQCHKNIYYKKKIS